MNAQEVAAVLAQHWATRLESGYSGKWACTCGEGIAPKTDAAHQEHMAAEVVKALEGDGGASAATVATNGARVDSGVTETPVGPQIAESEQGYGKGAR